MEALTKDLLVFVETNEDGTAKNVGIELLTPGREIATKQGGALAAVVIGNNVQAAVDEVNAYGADKIYVVEGEEYAHYTTDAYQKALIAVIEKYGPTSMMLGATNNGRDLAPRVSCYLKTGLTADCTGVDIDEATGKVAWTRPTFGGNLFGTIVCKDTRPQMATIRPKVFELAPTDPTRTGEVEEFTPTWRTTDPQVFVEKVIEKVKADVDITKADILVGAGRGAENCLDVLQKVADELGGVVCCTRAVVEDGFLDKDRQVGQTGKTVRPSLYIACGISGAVQHCAGMDKSDLIISINRDPQAEIFNISNMGFVGDCATVLPLLVESIKAAKAE